ncbi:MAG: TIGR02147 family protein [Deltaproteobacteria bacterium]|nr:TIGR02147 family protein [Deltaproteobacteria bacterium]
MKKGSGQIRLFDYLDYRQFLKDWYAEAKRARGSFSFRAFSKRAGFTSPNFLKLVMDGERNLTEDSLSKFVIGLKLNKQEEEFFRNLVFFNQAVEEEKKALYYERLIQSRKFNQLKPIQKSQYEYCSTWHHSVIRELVASREFDGTPEWLARRISPPITGAQAKKSLEALERLGFIAREGGSWKQTSAIVSTGAEVASLALFQYHLEMLDLAKHVMHTVSAQKRDVSALTLGVKKERISELKKKIQEFRQEILKLVSTDSDPEEVVQLNIQMFPLTRSVERHQQ